MIKIGSVVLDRGILFHQFTVTIGVKELIDKILASPVFLVAYRNKSSTSKATYTLCV